MDANVSASPGVCLQFAFIRFARGSASWVLFIHKRRWKIIRVHWRSFAVKSLRCPLAVALWAGSPSQFTSVPNSVSSALSNR